MSSGYDFRIEQPAYVEAFDIYEKMESELKREEDNIRVKIGNLAGHGCGSSIDTAIRGLRFQLESGDYMQAKRNVTGMKMYLEDMLPVINSLSLRCEEFVQQLTQNDYKETVQPARGDNSARNGGIVSLNYDLIASIEQNCENVRTNTDSMAEILKTNISKCSGIMDVSSDLSALSDATNKLRRISNFLTSFQIYQTGVRALEYEMQIQLQALAESENDLIHQLSNANTDEIPDTQKEMDALNLWLEDNNPIDKMLNEDPEGTKGIINNIVQKDASEWNEIEAQFIADLLSYAFDQENNEIIEIFTNNLVCAGNRHDYMSDTVHEDFLGSIMGDQSKVLKILEYVDTETDTSCVSYLCEISQFCMEINPCALSNGNPTMEHFITTPGLADYHGRLIESCAFFEDGNLCLYLRGCPDGIGADSLPEQQIYGIFLSRNVLPEYLDRNNTIYDNDCMAQAESQYNSLLATLPEENVPMFDKFIGLTADIWGGCFESIGISQLKSGLNNSIDPGTDGLLFKNFWGNTASDLLRKKVLSFDFIFSSLMTVSEEMAAWAAANEETLKEYYQTQMRLCRDNRLADASLLDMNVVECYSGVITDVRYSEWLDKKNGAGLVDGADWEEQFGDMDNVKIYLGESPYTESKVDEQNAKLKEAMKNTDLKHFEEIKIAEDWLSKLGKSVDELTYEDYLNMDTNTKNRILVLLGKANS